MFESILKNIGINIIKDIQNALSGKRINNTYNASKSLKSENTETNLKIKGLFYFRWLDVGRRPGKFPPVSVIRAWVASKLGITNDRENKSVAYLVGRKIANLGTNIYIDKSKGTELEKIAEKYTKEIQSNVAEKIIIQTKSEINALLIGVK